MLRLSHLSEKPSLRGLGFRPNYFGCGVVIVFRVFLEIPYCSSFCGGKGRWEGAEGCGRVGEGRGRGVPRSP